MRKNLNLVRHIFLIRYWQRVLRIYFTEQDVAAAKETSESQSKELLQLKSESERQQQHSSDLKASLTGQYEQQIETLQKALNKAANQHRVQEEELMALKEEIHDKKQRVKQLTDENSALKSTVEQKVDLIKQNEPINQPSVEVTNENKPGKKWGQYNYSYQSYTPDGALQQRVSEMEKLIEVKEDLIREQGERLKQLQDVSDRSLSTAAAKLMICF